MLKSTTIFCISLCTLERIPQSKPRIKKWRATTLSSCPPLAYYMSTLYYFTSSKINTIVYQIDKCLMVQIWSLKFIKSILDITYVGFDKNPSDYLHILLCSFLRISNGAELLFSSLQITFGYFKQIRSSDLPQYQ